MASVVPSTEVKGLLSPDSRSTLLAVVLAPPSLISDVPSLANTARLTVPVLTVASMMAC